MRYVLILTLAALVSACSYTDDQGVKRSGITGGALSDPACVGFNNYGAGCYRAANGSLQKRG